MDSQSPSPPRLNELLQDLIEKNENVIGKAAQSLNVHTHHPDGWGDGSQGMVSR